MKAKARIGLISLCLGLLMVVGCSKDSILPVKMKATIDGASWTSTAQVTNKNSTGFIITGTSLLSGTTSTLAITILGSTMGTYNVVATSNICAAVYTPNLTSTTNTYASTSGKVILTEVDASSKKISGTFQFTCRNTSLDEVSITSGEFTDLTYTEVSTGSK